MFLAGTSWYRLRRSRKSPRCSPNALGPMRSKPHARRIPVSAQAVTPRARLRPRRGGAPADQSNVEPNQARRIGPHVEAVEKALADTGSQMFAKRRIASAAASAAMSAGGVSGPDLSGLISSACAPTGVATTASPCASPRAPTSPALPRVRAAPECPRPREGSRCGLINPAKKGHSLRYCSPTATHWEQGLEKQPNHARSSPHSAANCRSSPVATTPTLCLVSYRSRTELIWRANAGRFSSCTTEE